MHLQSLQYDGFETIDNVELKIRCLKPHENGDICNTTDTPGDIFQNGSKCWGCSQDLTPILTAALLVIVQDLKYVLYKKGWRGYVAADKLSEFVEWGMDRGGADGRGVAE